MVGEGQCNRLEGEECTEAEEEGMKKEVGGSVVLQLRGLFNVPQGGGGGGEGEPRGLSTTFPHHQALLPSHHLTPIPGIRELSGKA